MDARPGVAAYYDKILRCRRGRRAAVETDDLSLRTPRMSLRRKP